MINYFDTYDTKINSENSDQSFIQHFGFVYTFIPNNTEPVSKTLLDFSTFFTYYPNKTGTNYKISYKSDHEKYLQEQYEKDGIKYDIENNKITDYNTYNAGRLCDIVLFESDYHYDNYYEDLKNPSLSMDEIEQKDIEYLGLCKYYLYSIIESQRAAFVYSHPNFNWNWDGIFKELKNKAGLNQIISNLANQIFRAECTIRVIDPAYAEKFCRLTGYKYNEGWHNQSKLKHPPELDEPITDEENEKINENYELFAPLIDAQYNDFDKNRDIPAFERFLVDYGYMKLNLNKFDYITNKNPKLLEERKR